MCLDTHGGSINVIFMKRKILFLLTSIFVCSAASADGKVQKFFNLTADEVKIDSVLPFFSCSIPLGEAWQDSVYTVNVEYSEYIDMVSADIERYKKITSTPLPAQPKVASNVVVDRKRGRLEVSFVPLVMRDGKWQKLVSFMVDVRSSAKKRSVLRAKAASPTATAAGRYADHSVLASGKWAKIRVPETGIYRITDALARSAGFSDASKVKVYGYGGALQNETLDGDYLAEYDDLKEIPTCTVDGQRLFHAQGPVSWSGNTATKRTRNPYSDYGYYFLTESDGEPLTVDSTTFVDSFYPSPDYYHSLHEVDNYAWYQGGRNLFEDSPIAAGSSASYALRAASETRTSGKVSVGVTAGQNSVVRLSIGNSVNETSTISLGEYDNGQEVERTYRISDFSVADTLVITAVSGGPLRLDYISVCYDEPSSRPILKGRTFNAPEYVYNITNQDHHADTAADMIIIVPTSGKLTAQAERIKTLHEQKDGMRVRIVPADELYNEFSSGTPDANAYRRYMKMLYDRAETDADMPSHLLLFGDCLWDNRLKTSACRGLNADDFLLCHESENSFSSTDCYVDDGFFCNLDDGEGGSPELDKGDVAVGRIPARDAAEAKIMVDKTLNYVENKNAGAWQNVLMFMGDDGNNNQHMKDADEMATLAETINPAFHVKRVMWDSYTRVTSSTGNSYPDATKTIKQQQEDGALIMNYSGHGGNTGLSHESVLRLNDFKEFSNTNLPLWITASCDIMPFDSQHENIGETAMLNSKGGAVAFFGTTRTVWVDRNRNINRAYLQYLLTPVNGKYISVGEAQRQAKNYLITTSDVSGSEASYGDKTINKLQYSLLGDPALVLNIPVQGVVVDSINGVSVNSENGLPSLSAGSVATIKGHVSASDGATDSAFGGVITATVRDSRKLVVCRLNDTSDSGASTAFEYYDRANVLYNGSDSIRSGEFSISFAVPKDIDYSNQSGLVNLVAVNSSDNTVLDGYNEDFTVGGTGSLSTDSIGPSLYCYLNSTSFSNGDNVNATPYFVAEIYDKDGINASGSGIGHDLTLVIDGDANKTYNLNDNFTFDFGSYTRGSTYYNIPELEPGKHKLRFRAWDIMNNSSTTELTFNVVDNLKPGYISVGCTQNPARTGTTFIVNHDRAGSSVNIEIEVFDISGRPLWKHRESGTAALGAYTVDWDLCGDNGGKLHTGVYIYRVKIGCDGSDYVSQAKKLVIIDR